jgi:hypothetical protein
MRVSTYSIRGDEGIFLDDLWVPNPTVDARVTPLSPSDCETVG